MSKKIIAIGLVLLWVGLWGAAWAQEDYRLGPEDEIEIRVWNHDDLTRKVRVGLKGTISFPFVGEVKAQGLSVLEMQKEIERGLGPKFIIDPRVSIIVTDLKSQKFSVLGNVQHPGNYPLTKTIKVVEAISLAGGIALGGESKTPVTGSVAIIVRGGRIDKPEQLRSLDQVPAGQKTTVSLPAAFAGDPKHNLEIKNGDVIYVPNLMFYVTGEVKSSGRFSYEEHMTVLMAVTIAGGLTDKASRRGTYIVREEAGVKQKIKVKMDDPIQPGDTIVVPESFF